MSTINQQIKDLAAPGVLLTIEWALRVHQSTMDAMTGKLEDGSPLTPADVEKEQRRFTLDEREEARKILLEYGAGKPTRIVEHRGSKQHPIAFRAVNKAAQLPAAPVVEAEVVLTNDPT